MMAALWNIRAAYCAWRSARALRRSKVWAARAIRAEAVRLRWLRPRP